VNKDSESLGGESRMKRLKLQDGFSLLKCLIAAALISVPAVIIIPNLLASRRAANENSAISYLREIAEAEAAYMTTAGNGKYGSLSELKAQKLIDDEIGSGVVSGYLFAVTLTTDAVTKQERFVVTANPVVTEGLAQTGTRRFCITESGVLYADINTTTLGLPLTISEIASADGSAKPINY
jgi:type IV pilus assembly protein PilA